MGIPVAPRACVAGIRVRPRGRGERDCLPVVRGLRIRGRPRLAAGRRRTPGGLMTRGRLLIGLSVAICLALLVRWVAHNTYWEDAKVAMPPKGEALVNPFYAVQRVATALGARATWDRALTVPSPDAVIVLSSWHWSLSKGRRATLER